VVLPILWIIITSTEPRVSGLKEENMERGTWRGEHKEEITQSNYREDRRRRYIWGRDER
jgi:hypothetical protein